MGVMTLKCNDHQGKSDVCCWKSFSSLRDYEETEGIFERTDTSMQILGDCMKDDGSKSYIT